MGNIKTTEDETESRLSESESIEELLRARGIPSEDVTEKYLGQASIWILSKPLERFQASSSAEQTTEVDVTVSDEE